MSELKKSTFIESVATTPHRDIQDESLNLDGADISDLEEGRGFINSDHSKLPFASLVGRVVHAKKIYSEKDAETDYQKRKWKEIKKPFIASKIELWDGVGHKEADAIASIYKHYESQGVDAPIKVSVEGKILERGPKGLLKRTKIRGLALTVKPANRMTHTEIQHLVKSCGASEDLIKSEDYEVKDFIEVSDADGDVLRKSLEKILDLAKAAKEMLREAKRKPLLKCQKALNQYKRLKSPN